MKPKTARIRVTSPPHHSPQQNHHHSTPGKGKQAKGRLARQAEPALSPGTGHTLLSCRWFSQTLRRARPSFMPGKSVAALDKKCRWDSSTVSQRMELL